MVNTSKPGELAWSRQATGWAAAAAIVVVAFGATGCDCDIDCDRPWYEQDDYEDDDDRWSDKQNNKLKKRWAEECLPDGPEDDGYGDDYGDMACEDSCCATPDRLLNVSGCGLTDTLEARDLNDDYEAATISFRHASVQDNDCIRNDWDLLFGNDNLRHEDWFTVNTVTDDVSSIVDLGPVATLDLTEPIKRADYATGAYGDHDHVPVVSGHLYLVYNSDSMGSGFTLFRVTGHNPNRSVTIHWQPIPGDTSPEVSRACWL